MSTENRSKCSSGSGALSAVVRSQCWLSAVILQLEAVRCNSSSTSSIKCGQALSSCGSAIGNQ